MASRSSGAVLRQVRTLFEAGTAAGLSDGALLDRYLTADRPAADAAFAAVVERHGPMVHRVCLGVLGRSLTADADDAFQAVFVALARRAGSLRSRESLAPWLFGAARRIAQKARVAAARRRKHERIAADRLEAAVGADADRLEDWSALYEEIDRLPASFRAPIVLCALEGRSAAEAAASLGVAEGTIHSRLSRARDRLRRRLSRRGVTLGAAPFALTRRAAIGPPRSLIDATIRTVAALAAGRSATGTVPVAVMALVSFLSRRTVMNTRFLLGLFAIALGPVAAGLGDGSPGLDDPPSADADAPTQVPDERPMSGEALHVLIVEEDGTPAPDATVIVRNTMSPTLSGAYAVDTNGRLALPERSRDMVLLTERAGVVPVGGDESGPQGRPRALGYWTDFMREEQRGTEDDPIILTLRPLQPPITVRVVDEFFEPIEGADIFVLSLMDQGILGLGIRPLEGKADLGRDESRDLFGPMTTNADGTVSVAAPAGTWVSLTAEARHRARGTSVSVNADQTSPPPIVMPRGGGIAGLVIDAQTGEPVPGARVSAHLPDVPPSIPSNYWSVATTGPDGRYLIPGTVPGVYVVRLVGGPEADRLARDVVGVRVDPSRDAIADLELQPSRRLSGVVVSGDEGRPLSGVSLQFTDGEGSGINWGTRYAETDAGGHFSVSLLPGDVRVTTIASDFAIANGSAEVVIPEDRDPEPLRLVCEARRTVAATGEHDEQDRSFAVTFAANVVDGAAYLASRVYWGEGEGRRVIRGRIVDEAGTPVAGVQVWGIDDRDRDDAGRVRCFVVDGRSATTDRDGVFVLDRQPEGKVTLGLWRLPVVGIREEVVAAGVNDVEFVLPIRR